MLPRSKPRRLSRACSTDSKLGLADVFEFSSLKSTTGKFVEFFIDLSF